MLNAIFKRSLISVSVALACFSANASTYYVLVPGGNGTIPVGTQVNSTPDITVGLNSYALPNGLVGVPYAGFDFKSLLSISGDTGFNGSGVTWSVVNGSLPAGLTLDSNGVLSGTPTSSGTVNFSIQANYNTKNGQAAYQIYTTNLNVGLSVGTPPEAVVGAAYQYDLKPLLAVTGDNTFNGSNVSWSVVSSDLPDGLSLRTDGTISGTPIAAGSGTVLVRATYKGANGEQAYQVVSLNINISLAAAQLPAAMKDNVYANYDFKANLNVTGDTSYSPSNVIFSATGLPPGLTLSNAGVLSGTPSEKYTTGANFTVNATYKNKTSQQSYTIIVNGVSLTVTQIASNSAAHSCAITPSGGVKCWGGNSYGQLGNNSTIDSLIPVDVVGLTSGVTSIAVGDSHSCAITTTGGVKCWGYGYYGALGNNSTVSSSIPVDVAGLTSGIANISAGGYTTCAVTTSGGVKCWGFNNYGQLGINSTVKSLIPVDVSGLTSGISNVTVGESHTCAVTTGGGAKCWGWNNYGQLGTNNRTTSKVPVNVLGFSTEVKSLSAGADYTCAVTTSGGAKCWGRNYMGALGDGTTTEQWAPTDVFGLTSGVASISAAVYNTCAVTISGGAKCWGNNGSGQLGTSATSTLSTLVPTDVLGHTSGVVSISTGRQHTCAMTSTGGSTCWGQNLVGQLGNNSTTNSLVPTEVFAP